VIENTRTNEQTLEKSPKLKSRTKLSSKMDSSFIKKEDPFKSSNEIKRTFYVKDAEKTNILEYMNDYNLQRSS
jgi:hypothetical protein